MFNQQRHLLRHLLKSLRAHAITIHKPKEHIENWLLRRKVVELNLLKWSFGLNNVVQITMSPMVDFDHWSDKGNRYDFRKKVERKGGRERWWFCKSKT